MIVINFNNWKGGMLLMTKVLKTYKLDEHITSKQQEWIFNCKQSANLKDA